MDSEICKFGINGDAAAQEIQHAIGYAPNPIFRSGTPEGAPAEVHAPVFAPNDTALPGTDRAKVRTSASSIPRHLGMTPVSKTTLEVFTGVGPDNSLERLTEGRVGLITDRPSNVDELFVTLIEQLHRLLHPPLGHIFQRGLSD